MFYVTLPFLMSSKTLIIEQLQNKLIIVTKFVCPKELMDNAIILVAFHY